MHVIRVDSIDDLEALVMPPTDDVQLKVDGANTLSALCQGYAYALPRVVSLTLKGSTHDLNVALRAALEHMPSIRELIIYHDGDFDCTSLIPAAPTLTRLDLSDGSMLSSENTTDGLSRLTGLRWMSLWRMGVDDIGFVKNMHFLEHLNIGENNIHDLSPLSGCPRLMYLDVCCCRDGDNTENFAPLTSIKSLRKLKVSEDVSAYAVETISEIPHLRELEVHATYVGPDHLFQPLYKKGVHVYLDGFMSTRSWFGMESRHQQITNVCRSSTAPPSKRARRLTHGRSAGSRAARCR